MLEAGEGAAAAGSQRGGRLPAQLSPGMTSASASSIVAGEGRLGLGVLPHAAGGTVSHAAAAAETGAATISRWYQCPGCETGSTGFVNHQQQQYPIAALQHPTTAAVAAVPDHSILS
jgi:hypothetical protein